MNLYQYLLVIILSVILSLPRGVISKRNNEYHHLLHARRQSEQYAFVEQEQKSLSLDEVIALDVEKIDCLNIKFNEDLSKRVAEMESFFEENPERKLENSITIVLDAIDLIDRLQQRIHEQQMKVQAGEQTQSTFFVQSVKEEKERITSSIESAENTLFPESMKTITHELQVVENKPPKGSKEQLEQALHTLEDLRVKFEKVLRQLESYKQNLHSIKVKIDQKLLECKNDAQFHSG